MPSRPNNKDDVFVTVKSADVGRTRNGEPLTERSQDRILAAALEVFAHRGFDGATTAEVARRAGVTQPLVHYHFTTKDDLWRAAVSNVLDQLGAHFGTSARELADLEPVAQLKVLVRRLVHFSAAYPEFGRILAYEGSQGGPRLDWLLSQEAAGQLRFFHDTLELGRADGWLKDLPVEHVATCLAAASAYAFIVKDTMRSIYGIDVSDPDVIDRHADTVVELFFHGLLPTADRPGHPAEKNGAAHAGGNRG